MTSSPVRLEVIAGKAAGTTIVVEDELVIGRHAEGPGKLADDDEISRSHARIICEPSGYGAVEDLGSTNGTFVNGLRISGPATLSEGDTIELGGTTLVVRAVPSVVPDQAEALGSPQRTVAAPQPTTPDERQATTPGQRQPTTPSEEPPRQPTAVPEPVRADLSAPPLDAPAAPPEAPAEPAAPEPMAPEPATPEPVAPSAPALLEVGLQVDFEAREARIFFDEKADPIRLVFRDGAWRPAS